MSWETKHPTKSVNNKYRRHSFRSVSAIIANQIPETHFRKANRFGVRMRRNVRASNLLYRSEREWRSLQKKEGRQGGERKRWSPGNDIYGKIFIFIDLRKRGIDMFQPIGFLATWGGPIKILHVDSHDELTKLLLSTRSTVEIGLIRPILLVTFDPIYLSFFKKGLILKYPSKFGWLSF